ncbi:MAG: N-acetylglucosamine-6-phosphate deacetylase [Victivallales bacterium]|nr:N-acetylglucosamine-6-phosphate deacetylase [Victivallales bacterium]
MKVLLKNCHVISPDLELHQAAIGIDGDHIARVFVAGEELPAAEKTIDVGGQMVLPGFVDVHCHGRSGFEVTAATPEAIRTVAEDKLKEGVTTYLPTTLTLPEEQLQKTLQCIADYCRSGRAKGAKLPGVHLEGPYVNCKCLGAQNPDFVRRPDIDEVMRLNAIWPVLKVTLSVEVEGGVAAVRDLIEHGITPSCGHSAANYEEFHQAREMGLVNLTHFCNQMTPLHHRDIGLVGAGLLHDEVYTEMICDKIHVSPNMIRLVFKVKNIDHILLITDAMQATGLPDGLSDIGGLAVVVKNGEARLASNGALAGSTLLFNRALKNVYEVTGLPLTQLVKTTSLNQAHSLGLTQLGKIQSGYYADLVVLDDNFDVVKVLVNGEVRY